jgi:transcriptional regulator with XRE-family HTH domain
MAQQCSLTSYVADRFYNELFAAVKNFIEENTDDLDLNLRRINRFDGTPELTDISVKYVSVSDLPESEIGFDVAVEAEINAREADYHYDIDEEATQWFMLKCQGNLECGLDDIEVKSVAVYNGKNRQTKPMSDALVPIIKKENLEAVATDFLKRNYPKALLQPMAVDPEELAESMGLKVKLRRITGDCSVFGQIYFHDSEAEFYDAESDSTVCELVEAKTIFVDPDTYFLYNLGKVNNTIVHECVHWDLHRKAFELERLYNKDASRIKCQVTGGVVGNSRTATEWMEWQANALAPRIQMPLAMFKTQASKYIKKYRDLLHKDDIIDVIEPVIDELASFFCVSRLAAKIRMVDTGYEEAIGAFIYIDGRYVAPHRFKKDAIRENQTFSISAEEAAIQTLTNKSLGDLVKTGIYQYVDSHFVLNHPRYLVQHPGGLTYLTDYARNHMDECCIPFDMTIKSSDKKDYHSVCYLNKDKDSTVSFDIKYGDGFAYADAEKKAKLVEDVVMEEMAIFQSLPNSYELSMQKVWEWKHEKEGLSFKELAERIHMDDQTISRIVNCKRSPQLNSLVLIFLGMHLPPTISLDLIQKSPVSFNFTKQDHVWYHFALTYLSKQSMDSIEKFFHEHNVQI